MKKWARQQREFNHKHLKNGKIDKVKKMNKVNNSLLNNEKICCDEKWKILYIKQKMFNE